MHITKTWLRKNLKTGPNHYGCGFILWKNGEVSENRRSYAYTKKELIDKIYDLQDKIEFDSISLHSPSATGLSDSGNRIKVPNRG